jgi:hypothetical protein
MIFFVKLALGQIQTTIGKAHLLINQKFKQFKGLCDKNIVRFYRKKVFHIIKNDCFIFEVFLKF